MPETTRVPTVHVVEVRPIHNGNLKGFASIRIGPLTVRDFRIIQQPNQRAYVSAPQQEYFDADGRKKFKPLLDYPDTWRDAIKNAVLEAWENNG